jgi:hypothetical protein
MTAALVAGVATSCDKWVGMEPLKYNVSRPDSQDPALWAEYLDALKEYKASDHFISYAIFDNAPTAPSSEKDFLRCLPDSLDIVSLTNAANLSSYDLEDIEELHGMGTKVLFQIDYAGGKIADLGKYVDDAIATVDAHSLDGFSFTGIPLSGDQGAEDASALIMSKLSAVAGPGKDKLLAFEGDPAFVATADRAKVDYFILDTEGMDNVTSIKMQVLYATGFLAIPQSSILLSAQTEFAIFDENKGEYPAITAVAGRVMPLGPLAGFAVHGANKDYFGSDMNYKLTRSAIQMLNPAK